MTKLHSISKIAPLAVFAVMSVAVVADARAPEKAVSWILFSNPALGYSFRYPKGLHVLRLPLAEMNMEGLVDAVDLKADLESSSVFRVLVVGAKDTRSKRAFDPLFLRQVCKPYEEFRVDGRLAINCVTCGSAACAWTVYIPGPLEFRLLSNLAEASEKPRPQDGRFPIQSIVRSFRWTSTKTAKP